jgi:hypothetical protein
LVHKAIVSHIGLNPGNAATNVQTVSLEQAVAMIPDGANLMIGGFMLSR